MKYVLLYQLKFCRGEKNTSLFSPLSPRMDATHLSKVATEVRNAFQMPPKTTPEEAVKAWVLAQTQTRDFIRAHGRTVMSPAAAAALTSDANLKTKISYSRRASETTEEFNIPSSVASWADEVWSAAAAGLCAAPTHDVRNFRTGDAHMTHSSDCAYLIHLDNELVSRVPELYSKMTNEPFLLYAMHNADDTIRREVAEACARHLDSANVAVVTEKLLAAQDNLLEAETGDQEDAARQFAEVMKAAGFAPGVEVTFDSSKWATAAPEVFQEPPASAEAAAEFYIGELALTSDNTLDEPFDAAVKSFAHSVGLDPTGSRDYQRWSYLVAGMRNAPQLVSVLLADETKGVHDRLNTMLLSGKQVHDEVFFPNLVTRTLENERTDNPLTEKRRQLLKEVNSFMKNVYSAESECDGDALTHEHVAMWLTANSAGQAAERLGQWFTRPLDHSQEVRLNDYLTKSKGPSPSAMLALRDIYFSKL